MKKYLSLLSAIAVIASAAACSDKKSESSAPVSSISSAEQTMYKENKLSVPSDFYSLIDLIGSDDGFMLIYYDNYFNIHAVRYNADLDMGDSFRLEKDREESLSGFVMTDKGLCACSSRSDEENASLSLLTFSEDGKVISSADIADIGKYTDAGSIAVKNISYHSGKFLISLFGSALIVSENGEITSNADIAPDFVCSFASSGDIICSSQYDAAWLGELSDIPEADISSDSGKTMLLPPAAGDERFPVYLILDDGVYGMAADGKKTMLLDFISSDILCKDLADVIPFGEGKFIAFTDTLTLLTVRPDDYRDERSTVTVGVHSSAAPYLRDTGTEFARFSDEYKVQFREYDPEKDDLWADILSDNSPDVYIPSGHSEVLRYADLGEIADFGELHDKYGGMTEDDLLPNIVNGMKYKGKLYSMSQTFVPSVLIANRDVISREQAEWEYNGFYDMADAHAADMYLSEHDVLSDAEACFSWLCCNNQSDWIDLEKAECYFDSPEFIRLLEFCRNANYIGSYGENYTETTDIEILLADARENMSLLGNKKALFGDLMYCSVHGAEQFVISAAAHSIPPEELTLVLQPSESRTGTFSVQDEMCVMTHGKCQQGGWEFVNYALSYDTLTKQISSHGPGVSDLFTRRDAFEFAAKNRTEMLNFDDRKTTCMIDYYMFSYNTKIARAEADYFNETVLSCGRLGIQDENIAPVLDEEFSRFINGEISAEECAAVIQDRVSIYLSENY